MFAESPMNFKDIEGNFPKYWIEYYKKLNKEIPQDKIGMNPNKMMESEFLYNICEIQKNDKISYSFYNIENETEIYNETKKALKENIPISGVNLKKK